ncbi:hypothetical protein D9M72_594350 [compost metagenome]
MAQRPLLGGFQGRVLEDAFQLAQQREAGAGGDEVLDDPGVLAARAVELVRIVLVLGHRVVDFDGQGIGFRGAQLRGLFLDVLRQALADIGGELGHHVGKRLNG